MFTQGYRYYQSALPEGAAFHFAFPLQSAHGTIFKDSCEIFFFDFSPRIPLGTFSILLQEYVSEYVIAFGLLR